MISFLVWDENSKFTLHILKLLRDFFKWIFETKLDFFLTLYTVCSTDMISEQDWKWPNYAEEPPFSLIFSS